ncbi:MAG: hypothetical protein LBL46_02815 [Rickettsiales bacterium]|nr:hypothetical protein [Rickettsiales bacterium]
MKNNKEQRIKNKYSPRTGKHLFIILYSLFIPLAPSAQAAKLCQHRPQCSWDSINTTAKTFNWGCIDSWISTYPEKEFYNGVYACTSSATDNPDNVSAAGTQCWCKLLRVPNSPNYDQNYANVWRKISDGCAAYGESYCATICQRKTMADVVGIAF